MNIGSGGGSGEPEVMMDINTTPLIDVMLVLLIMFIITIPARRFEAALQHFAYRLLQQRIGGVVLGEHVVEQRG